MSCCPFTARPPALPCAGSTTHFGGTMRLGARRTVLQTVDCIAAKLYQSEQYVDERHRHRWVGALGVRGRVGVWI